jgi:predicted aminopeptidase
LRLRLLLVLAASLPLAGCYLLQAASGQLAINARREPLERVLARPGTPPELAARLGLARRARDFASQALGLPDNASYRSYADLGRPYVVWNVYATAPFSADPRSWCFPVAGCVVYRGYFAERAARAYARRLEARGDDVAVEGVIAYSTLGHFADPILSTMLAWDDDEIAAVLFHELAHQVAYAPGDTTFNESFASVVEEEGLRRWLATEGRPGAGERHAAELAAAQQRVTLVAATRERLRTLYAGGGSGASLREAKAAEFARLRASLVELGQGSDAWATGPLNNASLVPVAAYSDCVPALAARLAAVGGDLARFYEEMRALARGPAAARRAVCGP